MAKKQQIRESRELGGSQRHVTGLITAFFLIIIDHIIASWVHLLFQKQGLTFVYGVQ